MAYSPSFTATGITGAGQPSRYVGATPGGAPVYGMFEVGDFVIDRSGAIWICTVAGIPGTWASGAGGGSGTVTSVTATDTSIVVSGTNTVAPTVATGTLDVIAAQHPPAGNWSNNSHKITSLANGSGAQDAAAYGQTVGGGSLAPMTTEGDLIIANATPAPARLPVGSANQVLGVASGMPAWQLGLTLQGTTGVGGYTLVNGTGTVFTYTTPNDGLMHRILTFANKVVGSTETGGAIWVTFTPMSGAGTHVQIFNGGAAGGFQTIGNGAFITLLVAANTAVAITQNTALTGGASTLWAEIWGS